MADLNIGVTIGGAVSETFNNAMRTAERNVNSFRNNVQSSGRQAGDAFRSTEQRLNRISTSAQNAGSAIGNMANAHRRASAAAQQHLTVLQRLGNAVRNIRLENVMRGASATIGAVGGAIAGGIAVNHFFDKPKDASANFDLIVTRALKKEGIYGDAAKNELKKELMGIAQQFGVSADKIASGLNGLMEQGQSLGFSKQVLRQMTKFTIASESSIEDSAALTNSLLLSNVKPEQLDEAYAMMTVGGKEGAYEVKDMAKNFPQILAVLDQMGYKGLDAVKQAVVMVQTARKVTGNSDEATTLVLNGLEKFNDTATTNRYNTMVKKDKQLQALGYTDYKTDVMKLIASGLDPFSAQIALVKKITAAKSGVNLDDKKLQNLKTTDPEKYKTITDQLIKVAESFALGEMFAEQRARGNLLANLQHEDFAKNLKNTLEATDGKKVMEQDFQAEMNSQAGIKGQKEAANTNQQISMGEAMAETTKSIDKTLKDIYDKLGAFWGTSAGKAVATVAEPVGTVGSAVASGVGGLVAGGLLTGGTQGAANAVRSIGNAGRSATSLIGRALSSTAGRALGAVGAVGVGGYNAYQTYQNRANLSTAEQGEGYGGAIGGTGGALGGAALGAAIGSMVPVIGTVIGGLIGGAVGAWGGNLVGGTIGKEIGKYADKNVVANKNADNANVMPKDKNDSKAEKVQNVVIKAEKTQQQTEKAEPQIINNTDNSQHPVSIVTNVTVQGNADDPAKIAAQIYPHIEQKIKDVQARQQANSVFDNR